MDLLYKTHNESYNTSHNAPICDRNVHICAYFCYNMVHCVLFV